MIPSGAEPADNLSTQPVALFRSGLMKLQAGDAAEAWRLITAAIAAAPGEPRYRLGAGLVAMQRGQWLEAALAYEAALALAPGDAEAWNLLGNCRRQAGQRAAAGTAYRSALALQPDAPDALSNLGSLLLEDGDAGNALPLLHRAHALAPQEGSYTLNLGIALCRQRDFAAAVGLLAQLARREPRSAEVAFNLGVALRGQGRVDEAAALYREAIALRPDYLDALINLGNVCRDCGELAAAATAYGEALRVRPGSIEALNNAGCLARTQGELDLAEARLREALAQDPGNATLHDNLGSVLKDAGALDAAIDAWREALRLDPACAATHSNLCYALSFQCSEAAPILAECRRWNARFTAGLADGAPQYPNGRVPGRRLRVGYVSADFRDHCQALFLAPLLAAHDPAAVEVWCYSGVVRPDAVTAGLRRHAAVWRDARQLDDAALAAQVRADGIDILVDLTMHMAGGRPLVFARRPAPVQIAWLAYPGTTGITAIDWRISDARLDPPGSDGDYSERTLRLQDSFWCYAPLAAGPDPGPLPALAGAPLTFGCLNNPCKLTDSTLALWGPLMQALPAARLLLLAPTGRHRQLLATRLGAHGITAERVEFVGYRPREEYLATYRRIDIGLDTLPYNGHTTSLDSLWMGVPVVTRIGRTCAGRATASQLFHVRLTELAADSDAGFIAAAVALASDLAALAGLRATLRARLQASPLMDGPRFARQLEAAYRTAWMSCCTASPGLSA